MHSRSPVLPMIGATLAGAYAVAVPGVAAAEDAPDPHCSQVEQTVTCVWDRPAESGEAYSFAVPDHATDISVTAVGGAGASGAVPINSGGASIPGGSGAVVSTTFADTEGLPPGHGTLYVLPGAAGGMDNGEPGQGPEPYAGGEGGAGGSASIVTTDADEPATANTVVFAAGGGGGGGASGPDFGGGSGGDGASFATSRLPDLTSIGTGGSGGAGGIGDTSGDWNYGGQGADGNGHGGDGGDGARSGLGSDDRGPGGDGGAGGDGGDGYGGHGGDGSSGHYWGGAPGSTGGQGGDGYGAGGGNGGRSDEGAGGDGGAGGLSYIHDVSTSAGGVWTIVGEPTDQAPGVTIVFRLSDDPDDQDDGSPQSPGLIGSLIEWGSVITGSLATGSGS